MWKLALRQLTTKRSSSRFLHFTDNRANRNLCNSLASASPRFKSTVSNTYDEGAEENASHPSLSPEKQTDPATPRRLTKETAEVISFAVSAGNSDDSEYQQNPVHKPLLLNAKDHAIGYLSKILNARVYEAAIETELQHAKNLSAVRGRRRTEKLESVSNTKRILFHDFGVNVSF
jgi:hypothetical protein